MFLECSCGKMYRVRDDAANPPTKCPACGGTLKAAAGGAPSAPAGDGRVKELESRLQAAERERASAKAGLEVREKEAAEAKARVKSLEHDLHEAQASIARLGADLEKAQNAYKEALKKKDAEIDEKQKKIAELEGGTRVRAQAPAQTLALLKAKDEALQEARERVAELEEALAGKDDKGGSSEKVAQLEHDLQEAQASLARLGADLEKAQAAYKEALKKKDAEIEEKQQKIAALEKQPAGRAPAAPAGSELARAQARIQQLERIVQDGEQRYRAIQEKMEKAEGGDAAADARAHADALAQKDKVIADLRDALAAEKARAEELQKQPRAAAPAEAAVPARLGEARYLASDLDKSLSSVGSALSALVERVKRLNESLQNAEAAAPASAAPPAPTWGRPPEAAAPEEPEPAPAPEPAPEPEPEPEPQPVEAAVEAAPAEESSGEDIASLETLPEPVLQDDGLPADETLLDMGKMGPKGRAAARRSDDTFEPPPGLEEPAPSPLDQEPLSAETSPGPVPEEAESEPEPPKKKGLFGKLFGKKK
jgi:hypothetical protein